jgi:hypothetical protein
MTNTTNQKDSSAAQTDAEKFRATIDASNARMADPLQRAMAERDSSAANGELVGEVKKDRATGIPYIDWKRDHTLLPVGFKLYGARAPQASHPIAGRAGRASSV